MKKHSDVIIVGGGAVGCAIAYQLSRYDLSVLLLEQGPDVCMGASGKNSGVVHAGFNNRPGSLMAELCVRGNIGFEALCQTLDVPYNKTGKLVVALDDEDLPIIDDLLEAGEKNGCIGLSKAEKSQMLDLEPNARGLAALYSSNTAIINPFLYTIHLAEAALQNGVRIMLNRKVTEVIRTTGGFSVNCAGEAFTCNAVINSAGLYSDKVAAMGGDSHFRIYPNRGEYLILDKNSTDIASRPIYPVPRKGSGGLGVHLTPTTHGNMLIGPGTEYVRSCEQYANTKKMMDTMLSEAKALLPLIDSNMVIGAYTGIRAKTVPLGSVSFGDFVIEESSKSPGFINLVGIESPGLTASMPIAEIVSSMLESRLRFAKKTGWIAEYKKTPVFSSLDLDAQSNMVLNNPDYGEIICRCENVTKAELLMAINNPLGVRTLTGIKNRIRTMTGRCQGGYCFANIIDIMAGELNVSFEDIAFRNNGDSPLFGRMK